MATKKRALKKKPAVDERQQLDRWKKQGKALGVSHHQWAIADWILRGMKLFKSKKKAYDEAVELTGMTRETLQQFKMTAEFFPISTRVKDLWFGHHRLVANKKYTPDQRKRFLQHAKGLSVDRFAAYLRNHDKDATLQDGTPADRAVDAVIKACDALLGNSHFDDLLDEPPSPAWRSKLLERLKEAVAELNTKVEQMATAWREHEEADEVFLRASSQDDKVMGVGAGQ